MHQTPPESALPFDADALARQLTASPEDAFATALQAAQAGQAAAQLLLAQMHMEGKGTSRDPSAAHLWYSVAANNGDPMAMNMLGRCHELGEGTPVDLALAAAWYRHAADAGLDWGMYNYANLLATGRGVAKDGAKALSLYTQAAQSGHAKSMNLLARHLEEGMETPPDPQAALHWYRRSAEAGDFRGQANYAAILLQQGELDQAIVLLRQALAHGSPSFMAHIVPALAASEHPRIRALVAQSTA